MTGGKGGSNSFASCDLYAPSLCALAYSTSGNGTLYGVTPQVVPIGGDASAVLAIPHNGYHFINWTGLNGFVTNTENPLIVTNVQSGMTLTANFALNTYTLSMEVYPNGSGTTNPVTGTATHGVPTAISAIPASGYHFVNWFNTATVTVANTSLASTTATLSDDAIVIASFSPNILTMAVSPVGSGSTSPSIGTVSQAGSVAITATPAAFYHFVNWTTTANASLVDSNSVSTTATITGDATVTANFALDTYVMTLAVSPTNSGTTSPVSTGAGTHGVPTAISATPSTGYHFVNWTTTANAAVADAANASTTATLVGVATVTANFTLNTYTLSMAVSLADKGSTIPASTGAATHGIATSISATPATGYHFTSWTATANATLVSLNSPSTTATLIGDATVTANFAINSYTVNFLAGANGIVTGVASQVVNHGANCSGVLAVAAAHYHFVNWTGTNDFLTTTTNPLTVSNVPETMTITANFAIDSFPVTFAVGTNGTLSGTAVQAINYGDSTTAVTAVPAAGYHFTGWTGDHTGMDNPLTITNVTASKAITAIFVINQYSVVFQAGANGSIQGTTSQTINHGSDCAAVSATPNSGFMFSGWSGDCTGIDNPLTIKNITANKMVTANFSVEPTAMLTIGASPGGAVTPSGSVKIKFGESLAITATADSGYRFTGWTTAGGASVEKIDAALTKLSATADGAVIGNFVKNTALLTVTATTGGTATPFGATTVTVGEANIILAKANDGYAFSKWTTTEKASLADALSPYTTVTLSGDAAVTASFVKTSCALAVEAFPASGGTTTPSGGSSVATGADISISAAPTGEYAFTGWLITGDAECVDKTAAATTIRLSGNAKATAFFSKSGGGKAVLRFSASPAKGGTTEPSGDQNLSVGDLIAMKAVAAEGWGFIKWQVSAGSALLADEGASSTFVTVKGNATVSALFAEAASLCAITVESGSGGTTSPSGSLTMANGSSQEIRAIHESGYVFSKWTVSGLASVANATAQTTTLTVTGDGSVSASFVKESIGGAGGKVVLYLDGKAPSTKTSRTLQVEHGNDKVNVLKFPIQLDSFDVKSAVVIGIDGNMLTLDSSTGTFTQKKGKSIYTFKSKSGASPKIRFSLNLDAKTWSLKVSETTLSSVNANDGVDLVMTVAGTTVLARRLVMAETSGWSFDSKRNSSEELDVTGVPFDAYSVDVASGKINASKPAKSTLSIKKALVGIEDFDPEMDDVQLSVGEYLVEAPAGSFDSDGDVHVYRNDTEGVSLTLDLAKGAWSLKATGAAVQDVHADSGLDIRLVIGAAEGAVRILPTFKRTLTYAE